MIPAEFDYHRAESVDDAIRALADGGEEAKLSPAATRCCR